jgi:hypothetical protein
MKKTLLVKAAVLTEALVAAIALANPTFSLAQNADSSAAQRSASSLTQHMTANLEKSNFMPSPFSVQANVKSNNPVTMFITPNSMAEVTATDKSGKQTKMFIAPNSMAEVPANSFGTQTGEKNSGGA